jgi:hypothetical protein
MHALFSGGFSKVAKGETEAKRVCQDAPKTGQAAPFDDVH